MWPELISAMSAIGAVLVSQALVFAPESRRLRRIKAYVEIRAALEDPRTRQSLDDLISGQVDDEVRARARSERRATLTLRAIVWTLAVVAFAATAIGAWLRLDDVGLAAVAAAVSIGAVVVAYQNTQRSREKLTGLDNELTARRLLLKYIEDAHKRGLHEHFEVVEPRRQLFDLVLYGEEGAIAEVVEAKVGLKEGSLGGVFRTRLLARQMSPDTPFVVLLDKKPDQKVADQLRRMGATIAYLGATGEIDRA